jgi:hypothetical protein
MTDPDIKEDSKDVKTPEQVRREAADTRKKQFEADQKTRAEIFERDATASERKLERGEQMAAEKAEYDAKVAAEDQALDDAAIADGLLTHDDLVRHRTMMAPHHDCLLPHQALAEGEATVRMAFPRTVVLTQSAVDLRHQYGIDDPKEGDAPISAIAHGSRVLFRKGYRNVPLHLADSAWLADNGAYRVGDDGKPETADARAARLHGDQKPSASDRDFTDAAAARRKKAVEPEAT